MINESQQLSERERQILYLVANGRSNQQIANELGISVNTVKVHLRNVFGKIGAASRTEASMYAVRMGIVSVERQLAEPAVLADDPPPESAAGATEAPALSTPQDEIVALPLAVEPAVEEPPAEGPRAPIASDQSADMAEPQRKRIPRGRLLIASLVGVGIVVAALLWLNRTNAVAPPGTSVQANTTPLDQERWRELPTLPGPRAAFAMASVGDRLFVIGGENEEGVLNSVLRYDATSETWITLSDKPTPVSDIRTVILGDKLYVPGGRRSGSATDITAAFERYDPRSESWESLPELPAPRSAYGLAALEGKLYLFGGWDGTEHQDEVFEFDPERNTWRQRKSMPTARSYADAVVVAGSIYVIGGENSAGAVGSNEQYTPSQEASQPWTKRPPLPQPRSRFGTAVALSAIYVFGGAARETNALQYDVRTERWQSFETPQVIGSQAGVALLDDTIVAVGGKLSTGEYSALMQGYRALFFTPIPLR